MYLYSCVNIFGTLLGLLSVTLVKCYCMNFFELDFSAMVSSKLDVSLLILTSFKVCCVFAHNANMMTAATWLEWVIKILRTYI